MTQLEYTGPTFNVHAHICAPDDVERLPIPYNRVYNLTEDTRRRFAQKFAICGDALAGPERIAALSHKDSVQVINCLPHFVHDATESELIRRANELNDYLAGQTRGKPQFIPIATIPPPSRAGGENAARCAERAIRELGMRGIYMMAHYDGRFLGDPVFEPIFVLAAKLEVCIVVHPTVVVSHVDGFNRRNEPLLVGFINDVRMSALDFVASGVLERHPNLKIIWAQLGGGIIFNHGRLDIVGETFPAENELSHPHTHYLKQMYYEFSSCSHLEVEFALRAVGEAQILTGTDFPFWDAAYARRALAQLNVDPSVRKRVAWDNAAALFAGDR
ncbi:MAG: amidohydrolase family protein [Candidatus Binatia bacterium]